MKAGSGEIAKRLRAPGATRLFLLYGEDEAGSRALAALLGEALGADAERVDLKGSELKADPARLADEAAAIPMFGGARYILIEQAGDEAIPAIAALLDAPAAGNPAVLIAGTLRSSSALLKLALASPHALVHASWLPDERDAARIVEGLARAAGLMPEPGVAEAIAMACASNRALIAGEIEKYACYLDAAPDRPQPLGHDALEALGASAAEGEFARLGEMIGQGDLRGVDGELRRLSGDGVNGIGLLRPMLRRFANLARLRAKVEGGRAPAAVMASEGRAIFWKEKDAIAADLARWTSPAIARAMSRLLEAERMVKAPKSPGPVVAERALIAVAGEARRLGRR